MYVLKTGELARLLEAFVWSKEENMSYLLSCHYLKQLQQLFASNLAAKLILIPHGPQKSPSAIWLHLRHTGIEKH